jgi:hypothetical protein
MDFKIYDPLYQLTASEESFQTKQTTATAGNIAVFGSGASSGQTIDSGSQISSFQTKQTTAVTGNIAIFDANGQTIDSGDKVSNLAISSTNVFTSDKTMTEIRKAFFVIKNLSAVPIADGDSERLFKNSAQIGPAEWPLYIPAYNDGTIFNVDNLGIITITNPNNLLDRAYRITSTSCSLAETNSQLGVAELRFYDEDLNTGIGEPYWLNCLAGTSPQFTNTVVHTITVVIQPLGSFRFSVRATNITGSTTVTVDPSVPNFNASQLMVERIC